MCTSFVSRGLNTIIGMNFDNNAMKYAINTGNPDRFMVVVDGGRGKYPSFGVNANGVFINNLIVDSNGRGQYKRPSRKVTHTTKLVTDILNGKILPVALDEYLKNTEVVNTPDWSCHNMICDSGANVWVTEPGRETITSPSDTSPFFVMTNFSLWDEAHNHTHCRCTRYKTASEELSKERELTVDAAFRILDLVKQSDGEWVTALSMVYSHQEHTVYYCLDRNFGQRFQYTFPR